MHQRFLSARFRDRRGNVSGGDARLKNNYTITEIAGELRHETEKAYLLFHGNKEGVAGKVALREEKKLMQMEEWLALQNGLIWTTAIISTTRTGSLSCPF
jgi:hypothetical protein